MVAETIYKLAPHRTMYLRGFDRRGAAAAMHHASANSFTVSGAWSDQADFAVLMLFDADDQFGHLYTTRYLPDFSLARVVLEFDLALTGCQNPVSPKYQSVPWGALSYIKSDETSGTVPLHVTSTTGGTAASRTYTVNGTPVQYDRVQLIYLGNVVFDHIVGAGETAATVAAALVAQINGANWSAIGSPITLSATQNGAQFTVTASGYRDGNSVELLEMHKTATCYLTPAGASKLTGGTDPASTHCRVDFTALGIDSVRQVWMTFAPALPYDSGAGNPALVAYAASEWSAVFTSWTVTDPNGKTVLKVAGPGSVTVGSRDSWASFAGSAWSEQAGFYLGGFARVSAHAADSVTVTYSCQYTHDVYLGTSAAADGGMLTTVVDGVAAATIDTYAKTGAAIAARRLVKANVAAGTHAVTLTVSAASNPASTGWNCWFDYLQAAVPADVAAPATAYPAVNVACDYDTQQTYAIAPERALWILAQTGFAGDIDFYSGVFFALKRVRSGGSFHQATVTLGGTFATGTGFGDGDAVFVSVSGTTLGAAVYPADTLATLAQRLVDGINVMFVGVRAAPAGTTGVFTITTLSPINGFTLSVSKSIGATGSIAMSGDIGVGNEGVWQVDASQGAPLNRAFADYLDDFCALVQAAGQTMTVAFSQELLAPPDANTAAGAWTQRFVDGSPVLTATGFGSWGAGIVECVAGSNPVTVQQTGHGYVTGNTVHIASATASGVWTITVTDANHYQLAKLVSLTGYMPGVGDTAYIELQTSQCCFNGATVTPYLAGCYAQAAGIMAAAGQAPHLTPWLQFGEILHWFFSKTMSLAVTQATAIGGGLVSLTTASAHGFATGQTAIVAGVGAGVDGTRQVTVTGATTFTVGGTVGTYAGGGTVSGGGMAFYDASQAAAAVAGLGRALASFYTQDDDPAVNGGADASFLAGRIKAHIDAIRAAVLAAVPGAKFELLWPYDVNYPSCYYTAATPWPQGGRLNRAVNLPAAYLTKSGSGLDRIKMEGLSWGATYRNLSLATETVRFPYTVGTWARADCRYLMPWFNGGCGWSHEYMVCLNERTPGVGLWAFDHLCLLDWKLPLPGNPRRTMVRK